MASKQKVLWCLALVPIFHEGGRTLCVQFVVDANYGSVTAQELSQIQSAYSAAGIDLTLHHLTTEQKLFLNARAQWPSWPPATLL